MSVYVCRKRTQKRVSPMGMGADCIFSYIGTSGVKQVEIGQPLSSSPALAANARACLDTGTLPNEHDRPNPTCFLPFHEDMIALGKTHAQAILCAGQARPATTVVALKNTSTDWKALAPSSTRSSRTLQLERSHTLQDVKISRERPQDLGGLLPWIGLCGGMHPPPDFQNPPTQAAAHVCDEGALSHEHLRMFPRFAPEAGRGEGVPHEICNGLLVSAQQVDLKPFVPTSRNLCTSAKCVRCGESCLCRIYVRHISMPLFL